MARPKVYPCLWFNGKAEEAANFYVSLLPDSRIDNVWRSPADTPSGPEGMVLLVDFTVAGQQLQGLDGGPDFTFNEAISLVIECEDQAEVDRLWDALTADGGEPGPCGWLWLTNCHPAAIRPEGPWAPGLTWPALSKPSL